MNSTIRKIVKYLTDSDYQFGINASLGFYKNMDDEEFLKRLFKCQMGDVLDLDNPKGFNEKMQWLKIHDRKSIYTTMVDKYEAKKYVAQIIGEEHILQTLGVWDSFDEINFDELPNQFVLKCTHDSGGLVICRDKNMLDVQRAKKKINASLKRNFYWACREWAYRDVKPRVIAEKYMEDENEALGLTDYKFFCFNGEPRLLYISQGLEDHETASISFFDVNGERMPFGRIDYKPIDDDFALPHNYNELVEVARKLANEVSAPFVRVDLYSISGKIFFSEFTFTPCGGMLPFEPKEWDEKLGSWICLPKK